jgi:hypothetical protein
MTDLKDFKNLHYGDLVDACALRDIPVTDKDNSDTLRAKLGPKTKAKK